MPPMVSIPCSFLSTCTCQGDPTSAVRPPIGESPVRNSVYIISATNGVRPLFLRTVAYTLSMDIDEAVKRKERLEPMRAAFRSIIEKRERNASRIPDLEAVSYTHLTLPTIY